MWEQDKWSWVKEDGGSVLTLMIVHISRSAAVIYIQLSRGGGLQIQDKGSVLRWSQRENLEGRVCVCVCMHMCLGGWAVGGESCICSQPQSAALKALSLNNGPHQCRERSHRHKCTQ